MPRPLRPCGGSHTHHPSCPDKRKCHTDETRRLGYIHQAAQKAGASVKGSKIVLNDREEVEAMDPSEPSTTRSGRQRRPVESRRREGEAQVQVQVQVQVDLEDIRQKRLIALGGSRSYEQSPSTAADNTGVSVKEESTGIDISSAGMPATDAPIVRPTAAHSRATRRKKKTKRARHNTTTSDTESDIEEPCWTAPATCRSTNVLDLLQTLDPLGDLDYTPTAKRCRKGHRLGSGSALNDRGKTRGETLAEGTVGRSRSPDPTPDATSGRATPVRTTTEQPQSAVLTTSAPEAAAIRVKTESQPDPISTTAESCADPGAGGTAKNQEPDDKSAVRQLRLNELINHLRGSELAEYVVIVEQIEADRVRSRQMVEELKAEVVRLRALSPHA